MKRKRFEWKAPKCSSGKGAFKTQGEALRALARIRVENAQAVVPGAGLRDAYKCRECGAYHLTKKDGVLHEQS